MVLLMNLNQHKNKKICHNCKFEECSKMGKLISRIPGLLLLISSLPGSALRMHVECQQAFLKPCLVKLISKDIHLIFSIPMQAS